MAGVEALLALGELAGDLVEITLLAPEPDFLYKPHLVEESFGLDPAERRDLAGLVRERGARFEPGALASVRPGDGVAVLESGGELGYDSLVVCVGGRDSPALAGAHTFPGPEPLEMDAIVGRAAEGGGRAAFVVPPGVVWPLPLYELALMAERRTRELGARAGIVLVTPEPAPLAVFGTKAAVAVGALLSGRGIAFEGDCFARSLQDGAVRVSPGDRRIEAAEVVALPVMSGPRIAGLPADERGFIPIDEHARVSGAEGVYAAGDGASFPIKQGGIGTQQADAAAERIAAAAGAEVDPQPFHPVLRGLLLTGGESLSMKQDVTGGAGEGIASADRLWWPPHKIGGRYLSAWLEQHAPHDLDPPRHPLEVEVELPKEWHGQPLVPGLDGPPES